MFDSIEETPETRRALRRARTRRAKARRAEAESFKTNRRREDQARQPKPRPAPPVWEEPARLLLEQAEDALGVLEAVMAVREDAWAAMDDLMDERSATGFAPGDLAVCHRLPVMVERWEEAFRPREALLRRFAAEGRTSIDREVTRVVARVEALLGLDSHPDL